MTVATGLVDAGRSVILDVELAAAAPVDGAPATEATAVSADIRLPNRQGLHARPAAVVAAAAKAFRADIRLLRGADAANAKSVTSILLLATNPNDAIRVSATGPDAAAAVSALAELLACGSGESQASGESAVPAAAAAPAIPAAPTDPRKLAGVSASPGVALGKVAQLRERAGDVRDVGGRVLGLLAGVTTAPLEFAPGSILIADELTPSETASLDAGRVLGLCTTGGGPTSHAAILARALGLPAVCGVDRAALELEDGTAVLLDGTGGTLLKNPDETEVAAARAVMGRLAAQRHSERAAASEPAATTDGHRIEIAANIGTAEEAVAAVAHGAEAVGLLRSELLFLDRDTAPEEREQAEVYRAVAAALGRGRRLVIRTLDVGGDKPLAYLPLPAEQNPFLGLRGIRVSLERPDLLRSQLRAILAAAALSDVHVMFPMIATLDELRHRLAPRRGCGAPRAAHR